MLVLRAGDATCEVDHHGGAALGRLTVAGFDLLRTAAEDGEHHGSFVMAPWAGRTREARFGFAGIEHALPVTSAPHAIHGTVRDRPWVVEAADPLRTRLSCDLGPDWPFAGWVEQTVTLFADRLELALAVHASEEPMPAACGWHPWFQRRLTPDGPPVELQLPAGAMLRRDHDWIATRDRVSPPPPGPWDDCFVDLTGPPVLRWPGQLTLTVESACSCVVVYDLPAESVCVEPQTAPPDALNVGDAAVVTPGAPLEARATLRWTRP